MKQNDVARSGLQALGLNQEEVDIYLSLLRQPGTPLTLSRDTGHKRTKIYRIISVLEKRSLVARHIDDRGAFYVVTEPTNLGIDLAAREAQLKDKQDTLRQLVPLLTVLRGAGQDNLFAVRTYEGPEGFKQMCWHELKTKGELLALGAGVLEELVPGRRWAEHHRERTVDAGYRVREIINAEIDLPTFTYNEDYMRLYTCRSISARIVPLDNQIVIYNDTVAMYHWREQKKVGVEIVNAPYADMMRSIFEHYWKLAEPQISREYS